MAVTIPINLKPELDSSALNILDKQVEEIKKDLTDVSKIKLGDDKGFEEAFARRKKTVEELTVALQGLQTISEGIGKKLSLGDMSNLRGDIQTLSQLKGAILDIDNLINDARSVSLPTTNVSAITEDTIRLNNAMHGVTSALRSTREVSDVALTGMQARLENLKSGFNKLGQIIGQSLKESLQQSWSALKKYFGLIKSGFSSLFNYIKRGFSSKDTTSGIGSLVNQLKGLVSVFAVTKLTKSMMSLTNEAINMEGTLNNVFDDSSSAIRDWSNEFAERFTLTIQQARSFATQFGGVLQNLGLSGDTQTKMAENLTALSGDFASFYGTSVSDAADRLQAALTGQTRGLKALGIQMNDTLLNQFALNRGYQQAYSAMSEQNKAIVRYNYLLAQTVTQQGNASTSSMGWTNQIRILKQQLNTLGSTIGAGFVKLLYPVVQVLNKIISAVNIAAQKVAKIFGFDLQSVGESLGIGDVGGISDTTDAIDDEADALDNVGKSAKKASKGLASFDKLNNLTSESAGGSAGGAGGVGGLGGLIDVDSYFEGITDPNSNGNKFTKWLEELLDLLSDKKWKQAGSHVASGINQISDALYNKLTNPKIIKGIDNFNDAITDFADGLLDIDFNKIGRVLGAGINIITHAINNLYETATKKDILKTTGQKIAQFFEGLINEVNWSDVGEAFTTKIRALWDIIAGFADYAKENNLGESVGTAIKEFLTGAIERLFGNGGAEAIGRSIGELLNQGLIALGKIFEADENGETIGKKLGSSLVSIINNAVNEIKPQDLSKAFSGLLDNIADFFLELGNMDTDSVAKGIYTSINDAVNNGKVEKLVSGITGFLTKFVDLLGKVILNIDWGSFAIAVLKGIATGLSGNLSAEGLAGLAEAFGVIFGVKLIAKTFLAKMGLTPLANATVGELANAIKSDASASTLSGGFSSLFSSPLIKSAVVTAAAMMGASIVSTISAAISDTQAQIKQKEDFTKTLLDFDTSEVDAKFKKLSNSFSSLEEQITAVENASGKFNKSAINTDGWSNKVKTVEYLKGYLEDLRDAGLESTDAFEWLELQIENWDKTISRTSGAKKQTDAINLMIAAAEDCDIEINENRKAIQNLNAEDLSQISKKYGDFKVGMKFTPEELQGIADTAKKGGKQTADGYITEFNSTIDKDNTMQDTLSDSVEDANNSVKNDAYDGGKEVGKQEIQGIKDGADAQKQTLLNGLKTIALAGFNVMKSVLGIHSPSKLFRDEIGTNIMLGLVEGLSDEELAVQDEMQNIRDMMMQPFDRRDMSEFFDFSGIPSSIAINPEVNRAKLQSGVALEQSTQGILGSLGVLSQKTGKAGGKVQVNVYLDENNKLASYIVDTVSGQVVKGGNF